MIEFVFNMSVVIANGWERYRERAASSYAGFRRLKSLTEPDKGGKMDLQTECLGNRAGARLPNFLRDIKKAAVF